MVSLCVVRQELPQQKGTTRDGLERGGGEGFRVGFEQKKKQTVEKPVLKSEPQKKKSEGVLGGTPF